MIDAPDLLSKVHRILRYVLVHYIFKLSLFVEMSNVTYWNLPSHANEENDLSWCFTKPTLQFLNPFPNV